MSQPPSYIDRLNLIEDYQDRGYVVDEALWELFVEVFGESFA